jgi:bacteriorhodopsin
MRIRRYIGWSLIIPSFCLLLVSSAVIFLRADLVLWNGFEGRKTFDLYEKCGKEITQWAFVVFICAFAIIIGASLLDSLTKRMEKRTKPQQPPARDVAKSAGPEE